MDVRIALALAMTMTLGDRRAGGKERGGAREKHKPFHNAALYHLAPLNRN
jgi:hypothetical protein